MDIKIWTVISYSLPKTQLEFKKNKYFNGKGGLGLFLLTFIYTSIPNSSF